MATTLHCNRCERPICAQCAVLTPTGYRCKECVRGQQKTFETATTLDYPLAFVISLVLGYIGSLVIAALAILIPDLPLNLISVVTQIIGGILMTPVLVFLVLMTSDEGLMGEQRTKLPGRTWSWVMVALLIGLTMATLWHLFTSL